MCDLDRMQVEMLAASRQHLLDHVHRQGDSFADSWLRRGRQDGDAQPQSQPATPAASDVSGVPSQSSGLLLHVACVAQCRFTRLHSNSVLQCLIASGKGMRHCSMLAAENTHACVF